MHDPVQVMNNCSYELPKITDLQTMVIPIFQALIPNVDFIAENTKALD